MTLPSALWMHTHVSEREVAHTWPDGQKDDSHWEDCLWTSTVEWLNDTWKDVPDTLAYAEKLREVSGDSPSGGSNFGDVQKALTHQGVAIDVAPIGFLAMWAKLVPGTGTVATGLMGRFAAGSHWRRWDPTFTGGHAVEISRVDSTDRVWWCDPLAPAGTGYEGEFMSKADFQKFVGSWPCATPRKLRAKPVVTPPPTIPAVETTVYPITSYLPGQKAVVGQATVATNVRADPSTKNAPLRSIKAGATEAWTVIGYVKGAATSTGATDWLVRYANGRYEYVAKAGVKSVSDSSATTIASLTASISALTKRIAAIKAKVAANATDISDD